MNLQIIKDSKNKELGVFININDWKFIKKNITNLIDSDIKNQHLKDFKIALEQLKAIENGTLKSRPAIELLNEL